MNFFNQTDKRLKNRENNSANQNTWNFFEKKTTEAFKWLESLSKWDFERRKGELALRLQDVFEKEIQKGPFKFLDDFLKGIHREILNFSRPELLDVYSISSVAPPLNRLISCHPILGKAVPVFLGWVHLQKKRRRSLQAFLQEPLG